MFIYLFLIVDLASTGCLTWRITIFVCAVQFSANKRQLDTESSRSGDSCVDVSSTVVWRASCFVARANVDGWLHRLGTFYLPISTVALNSWSDWRSEWYWRCIVLIMVFRITLWCKFSMLVFVHMCNVRSTQFFYNRFDKISWIFQ